MRVCVYPWVCWQLSATLLLIFARSVRAAIGDIENLIPSQLRSVWGIPTERTWKLFSQNLAPLTRSNPRQLLPRSSPQQLLPRSSTQQLLPRSNQEQSKEQSKSKATKKTLQDWTVFCRILGLTCKLVLRARKVKKHGAL